MDTLRHHAPYKYSEFCYGHHGTAGIVVGNTIQVRLGALTIPLVAFWLKRVLGSRDCPQVGKVPCSFFKYSYLSRMCMLMLAHLSLAGLCFVLFFCAAAGFRLSLMRWLGRIEVRLASVRCQGSM